MPTAPQPTITALQQMTSELNTDGLAYSYLSRIAAHLSDVLTSLVMPIDELDVYDEDHQRDEH